MREVIVSKNNSVSLQDINENTKGILIVYNTEGQSIGYITWDGSEWNFHTSLSIEYGSEWAETLSELITYRMQYPVTLKLLDFEEY